MFTRFALLALAALTLLPDAHAQRRGDQDAAYDGRKSGTLLPLRAIEANVVPGMAARGADYIGAELDQDMARYRLKFVRDGAVIWIDVDGKSGQIVGRAGD